MPVRCHGRLITTCCLLLVALPTAAAERARPRTTPQMLVDLARDYGLGRQGRQTTADVTHVRILLQAAVRLDPQYADPYVWLYELAALGGDENEAARLLTGLLNADPNHEPAFARWLEAGLRSKQTLEEQVRWLEAVAATPRPAPQQAQVHVLLARLAAEQADVAEARRQLARATDLQPDSLDAATLAVQLLDEHAGAPERLQAALRLLELSPLTIPAAWRAAAILDAYGFADEAARLFDHALSVHHQADPYARVPGALALDVARNLLARGQLEEAIRLTRDALADTATAAQAAMFLYYLLEKQEAGTGAAVRSDLATRFARIRNPADHPANELAQAAWFYGTLEPQPDRALMLARSAAQRAPGDHFAWRVLGWAEALNHHPDEAQQALFPIAGRDPFAAYMLARLLGEAGNATTARRILSDLEPQPTCGPAFDLLCTLDVPGAAQPARKRSPEVARALAEFDERTLQYHHAPAEFLEARVTPATPSIPTGEPWWVTFTLVNRGPFPITLGPDGMTNPVFVLSFACEGDRRRDVPALMTVALDRVRVLPPGASVSLRRSLDVGPLRQVARAAPQQLQRISLHALLDAFQAADGTWHTSPGGQTLAPVYFNRLPAGTAPSAMQALFDALRGDDPLARVVALHTAAALLGEQQRAAHGRLEYRPTPVAADRLTAALVGLLGAESWELRVRALDALSVAGLDRELYAAVRACLEHPHWLVRLMALRGLARQGSSFADTAARLAEDDPDELVRALAGAYVAKWRAPTTAPAE